MILNIHVTVFSHETGKVDSCNTGGGQEMAVMADHWQNFLITKIKVNLCSLIPKNQHQIVIIKILPQTTISWPPPLAFLFSPWPFSHEFSLQQQHRLILKKCDIYSRAVLEEINLCICQLQIKIFPVEMY